MKKLYLNFYLLLAALLVCGKALAQPVVTLTPVITTGLASPTSVANAGDGSKRLFIVQKTGTILAFDSAYNLLSTFLTVTDISTNGERGLLSIAFHPDYENNGFFYVFYTNTAGNLEVSRYKVSATDANQADAASRVIFITIPHPTNSNHNGGKLHFGPDGFLYLSTGDGGGSGDVPNNAQNNNVLLGKMLRFNVNTSVTAPYYTIPAGNPYGNEVYDIGFRNPYRWNFDRQTGDMWVGDVGQDSWEEINFRAAGTAAGLNYGWRCYEGNATFNTGGCGPMASYIFPAHTYATQNPAASITGGTVYRGTEYPALQGWYIGADFYSGIFYKLTPNGSGGFTTYTQALTPTNIVDFGESEKGDLFALSYTGNRLLKVGTSTVSTLPRKAAALVLPRVANGVLSLNLDAAAGYNELELVSISGVSVKREGISGRTGKTDVTLGKLASGVYMVRLTGTNSSYSGKVLVP